MGNQEERAVDKTSATIDYLTGDLNRRGMYEYFGSLPENLDINFMFLDIDNFKGVNDTYGHAVGDKLLIEVSKTIKSRISNSLLARIGGDEFVVLPMPGLPERAVVGMAESILNSVNDIDISLEIKSIISFSIGIVMNQKKSMGLDNIMPKCDAAMYEAKRRGKNGYVIYSTIEDIFELKQVVDREKTQALLDGKFEVRYIPVMNISSSTLAAAKSYIVWNRGDVVWREENFLEFFEENGFVVELEQYAFTKICEMLVSSKDPLVKQIPIIFTISGVNINRVNFVDGMLAEVRSYGLKPDYFIFQLDNINDRIDTRRVIHFFEDIRNAGFGTALKGFGSAGASLMLMKNLALDYVSLGKGVISNLLKDNREGLFVKNILSLINDLNFEAVVEGIDDAMQVRYLNSYGCNLGSGSLFSDALEQQEYIRFAGKNSQITQQSVKFELRANLKDNSGKYEGVYLGDGREQFLYNSELRKEVLYCNGGKMLKGVIELPKEIVETQNFSVAIKFKVNNFINWSSLFYIMYENAFLSFMPFAWNGLCMYRIKDDLDEDGWYDIIGNKIDREWHTVVLTYNHKNRTAMLYVDGKKTGLKDPVINLQSPKRVILGGDIYAKSFEGFIDYLEVYDYVLSPRDVEKIVDK